LEGKTYGIAAISIDSCSNTALFLCNPDWVAERVGFDYLSFQQVQSMPTDSDYSQHPCGFQAYSYLPVPYTPVSPIDPNSDENGINGIIQ
jgi:hypothetical protein